MYQSKKEKNKLIRLRSVLDLTGISKSYIYQLVSLDLFPKPIQLIENGKAVAWVEQEVIEWIDSRIAARDNVVA